MATSFNGGLWDYAHTIPSMGGNHIGKLLKTYAAEVLPGESIVEVGVWLGSGTAFMAMGAHDDTPIHCYDRFTVNGSERDKAARQGVQLPNVGADTLPIVKANLEPFEADITYHKGDIRKATWDGGKIGLYVDDASKRPVLWQHAVKTFFPYLAPGAYVVLMDYNYYTRTQVKEHRCQYEWISNHQNFQPIPGWEQYESERAFKYRGNQE